jgi:hypothetical protein
LPVLALKIVRDMELLTILNHCHRHRGFVYQHARFGPTRIASKWRCDRGRARRRSARGATSQQRVTIIFPSGVLSSSLCGAFWCSCCTACGGSTAGIVAWWSRRFPEAMVSTS